jgi:hypothetical protein
MSNPKLEVSDKLQKSIEGRIVIISEKVKTITISSDEEYEKAGDFLTTVILPALSEVNEGYDDLISEAYQLHKNMIAKKRKYETPLKEARKVIERSMINWTREKARRQQEEVRRLQAAAEEEAKRRAEEEILEKIEAALENENDEESDRLIRVLNGDEADIDEYGREVEEREVEILLPIEVSKPKAEGVSIRKLKKYRVIDVDKIKREFMMVDEKKIQRVVTAMGEAAEELVGEGSIKVYEEESVAGRMRR